MFLRQNFAEYTQQIVDMATYDSDYLLGSSLWNGYQVVKDMDFEHFESRVLKWKKTSAYEKFQLKGQNGLSALIMKLKRAQLMHCLDSEETKKLFVELNKMLFSKDNLMEFLSWFPCFIGGLQPVALGLFSKS